MRTVVPPHFDAEAAKVSDETGKGMRRGKIQGLGVGDAISKRVQYAMAVIEHFHHIWAGYSASEAVALL